MHNIRIVDPYNPFYKKVLAKAASLGATVPSARVQSLDNGFLDKICRNDQFFETDCIWVTATDGDRVFASINWRNPETHRITETGTPTFTTNKGFKAVSAANIIRLNFVPSTNGVQFLRLDNSFYVYVFEHGSGGYVLGDYQTTAPAGGVFFNIRNSPGFHGWANWCGELLWPTAYADTSGGYHVIRDSDSNVTLAKDGVVVGTNAGATTRDVSNSMFGTCYNRDGVATTPNTSQHVSGIILGSELVVPGIHTHFKYRLDRL